MNTLPFPYKIVRSQRRKRTSSISIGKTGNVIITAPVWVPNLILEKFLAQKSDWVIKQLKKARPKVIEKLYLAGEKHLYFGEEYPLFFIESNKSKIKIEFIYNKFRITKKSHTTSTDIKKAMINWYLENGKRIITQKATHFAGKIGASINRITIKNVSSIWGSCSHRHNLNFNRKLIMAPHEIVDYVVIHEVSHLLHHNHGPKFWNQVQVLDPNFKKHRHWLRANSHLLSL